MANETSGALQRVHDAQERTDELREQLSQLARKLSAAYEEAARQNDLLADNRRPPVQFDHRVSAKSWRALAETAALTAQAWEGPATPTNQSGAMCPRCGQPMVREVVLELAVGIAPTAQCPGCGTDVRLDLRPAWADESTADTDHVAEAIAAEDMRIATHLNDEVVQSLFGVGLRLGSAVNRTTGPARQRIEEAIGELDATIAAIRSVAFGLTTDEEPGP
ncbi:MAG: hypothetical protein EKK42_00445 [Pseudonocardiaceae bacterium]|nr:MAG: hypothetical protein EKK42_00445 [Pseudonocardiaceae bacterium]